ncbi:hypothetical protein K450DRAFT_254325 [Umbelopsis ramanniana AG]|uniref:Uncharacterized protein n=1 Tax=Umbelopsis ramanniana AG TaxID=1314678 RepID=A0AAD5E567_UMBRA|nr:uncharacterized protein K450DRAFT_254325 [Umbelopsis ramanniana AG]KAI8576942.1 hypothetical protein K450DRAFT_254325 [Umbelopsis ramanniana AG]
MSANLNNLSTLVYAHLAANSVHGVTHLLAGVGLNAMQVAFVGIDVMILPLVGLYMYKQNQHQGALVCLLSIFASGMFGTYYHYIYVSADNVSQIPFTVAGILFMITAFLISFVDGTSSFLIYRMLYLNKAD